MSTPEKEITDKQAAFWETLIGESRGNIRAAMDIAGYSKMTKTSEVVSSLREEITERAGLMQAMNAPKAAFGIVDVLKIHPHLEHVTQYQQQEKCQTEQVQ